MQFVIDLPLTSNDNIALGILITLNCLLVADEIVLNKIVLDSGTVHIKLDYLFSPINYTNH